MIINKLEDNKMTKTSKNILCTIVILCISASAIATNLAKFELIGADTIFRTMEFQKYFANNLENRQIERYEYHKVSSNFEIPTDTFTIWTISGRSNNSIFVQRLPISPNDSLKYYLEKSYTLDRLCIYNLHFVGKNAAQYNYDWIKTKSLGLDTANVKPNNENYWIYKESCAERMKAELDFLDIYNKQHKLSDDFYNLELANIHNQYALKLYSLFKDNTTAAPAGFFDDVILVENKLSSSYFVALRMKYLYPIQFTADAQMDIYNNINKLTNNKDYLLCNYILLYSPILNIQLKKQFYELVEKVSQSVNDSFYLKNIEACKTILEKTGKSISDDALDSTLLIDFQTSDTISLRNLLNEHSNNAVYINFWASWCSPCRRNIKQSDNGKKYMQEKDITLLYLSIDQDDNKWRNAIISDHMTGSHYRFVSGKNSTLSKYIDLQDVPRYLLLDSKHNIASMIAPSITDKDLNTLKQIISF